MFKINQTGSLLLLMFTAITFWYCSPKSGSTVSEAEKTEIKEAQEEVADAREEVAEAKEEMAEAEMEVADAKAEARNAQMELQQIMQRLSTMQPTDPIPVDPDVKMGSLPNGLKYYIRQNEKPEDRVELRMALNAGSILEDEDQQGLAHFLEHMAFNGSKNFNKSELVDYLESIGTKFGPDLNAYTSFDETVYMLQVRTDEEDILQKGLTVLQDWSGALTLDHEEIDKERGVVMSEWRSGLSPDERMRKEWFPVMYNGSRYANRLPIGKPEVIQNAPYDAVKRFYRDWYRPNLMAIAIVGDVDVDEMEKEIKARFSGLKNPVNPRERKEYKVPMHEDTKVAIATDKEASFTRIQLMYKHPHQPVKTLTDYRQNLVRRLYNGMINERLRELAQSADAPFNYPSTSYGNEFGGIDGYRSFAIAPAGKAIEALKALLVENERVRKHGFTQGEMEREMADVMKGMERTYNERDKTDSRRFVMRYVYNFLDDIPMPSVEDEYVLYQALLPSIQLAEVNALAKKWVTEENRAVVITGPTSDDAPLPTEAQVRTALKEVSTMEVEAYEDEVSDEPILAEDLNMVAPKMVKDMEDLDVTTIEFPNGVKVMLKSTDFKNDQVIMSARSAGGHSLYTDEEYFAVANAADIVSNSGLAEFDATELRKKLAGKSISLNAFVSGQYEGMSGSTTPEDLETMLQLIYLSFTKPRKDPEMFQSFVNQQKTIYGNLMSNPQYFFMNETFKIKYDNHPRYKFPTTEDFESLELDQVYENYQDRFDNAGDFKFFFVGNFDTDEMTKMLGKYLGNLPGNPENKETWKDMNADLVKGVVKKTIKNGAAPKAMVDLTFHGNFEWTRENAYNFQSMVDVLSIKMRESMREDKGGVYGVRVSGDLEKYPTSQYEINISFNADPPMVDELIATAMNDIKNAKMNGADEKVLVKVKETQRQERIKNLKENGFWLNSMLQNSWYGGDLENIKLEKLEELINKFDSKNVSKAANKYFDMNNYIQIVMMPEE